MLSLFEKKSSQRGINIHKFNLIIRGPPKYSETYQNQLNVREFQNSRNLLIFFLAKCFYEGVLGKCNEVIHHITCIQTIRKRKIWFFHLSALHHENRFMILPYPRRVCLGWCRGRLGRLSRARNFSEVLVKGKSEEKWGNKLKIL